MNKTSRLVGIDLCRGLAAFAVILVHSGDETWGLPISDGAIRFRHLFYYAVPFFLAAYFYFGTQKLPLKINFTFWQKKLQRIVVPYLFWSIFYVVSKTVLFSIQGNAEAIQELLADPLAIIFLGAASYHLYFIPLILAGTALFYLANYLAKLQSFSLIALLAVVGIACYQLLIVSSSDFNIDSYTAFSLLIEQISKDNLLYQPGRILLVNIAWLIRCLPYFFIALLCGLLLQTKLRAWIYMREAAIAIGLFFLLLNLTGTTYLPAAISEVAIAYSFLLFGIAISRYIPNSQVIKNLGLCSFGIYLIHPFIKSIVEIMLSLVTPELVQNVTILSMSIYAVISFLLSWLAISIMQKNKLISRYI